MARAARTDLATARLPVRRAARARRLIRRRRDPGAGEQPIWGSEMGDERLVESTLDERLEGTALVFRKSR